MALKSLLTLTTLLFATTTTAKTDLEGCTSFTSMVTVRPEPGYGNTYASVVWYVPDTLEICKGVDCGGGRAPPKSVPGCPLYEGTETVTAEFLTADPMKPTAAVTTEEPKETGAEEVTDDNEEDEEESSSVATTIVTTTKPAESAAETTESPEDTTEQSSSTTGGDADDATTTGPDTADETGAAAAVAVNMLIGAAAAAFALL